MNAADIPGWGDICPKLSGVSGVWGVRGGGNTHCRSWRGVKSRGY